MHLSVVIATYRRSATLEHTLARLAALGVPGVIHGSDATSEVIVVDNASGDGSPARLREQFPGVQFIEHPTNAGVEAFNVGARAASGDVLFILDDDAWPDDGVLPAALAALAADPHLAAIALLPVHPQTRQPEWPFVKRPVDGFGFMGCANLVRTSAWRAAGGYEPAYFLYRNDTDLALTLGALGLNVRCDPAWRAWHDSPFAAAKSERWLNLATRNWLWLCRRHARGRHAFFGIVGGLLRALVYAGPAPRRLAQVVRGARAGLFAPAPPLAVPVDGRAFRRHLQQRRA